MRFTLEQLETWKAGTLPDLMGITFHEVVEGRVRSSLTVRRELLAPNGYLHAASVVALADSSCGVGCFASLPEGAENFTTIELKTNFLGTVLEGEVACEATLVHGGRTTQVWDARVSDARSGKLLALFRCTQLILYPRQG